MTKRDACVRAILDLSEPTLVDMLWSVAWIPPDDALLREAAARVAKVGGTC